MTRSFSPLDFLTDKSEFIGLLPNYLGFLLRLRLWVRALAQITGKMLTSLHALSLPSVFWK